MPWTEQAVETLKKLWTQGLTTVEISKVIGVSKNSVIGKVHRLGLAKRPSPIKQRSETSPAKKVIEKDCNEKKATSKKEKPIKEAIIDKQTQKIEPKIKAKDKHITHPKEDIKPEVIAKEKKPSKKETKTAFTPLAKVFQKNFKENISLIELEGQSCRWPFGDPKDEGFYFCGKKILQGQTYCQEHNEKAYVKQVRKS